VAVAVIDSGIDAGHRELKGRVDRAVRIEPAPRGHRVVESSRRGNADVYGHGTAVASIIARIAPNARLVDVRVLDARNLCTGETLLAGFRFAVEAGFPVVNMSLAARARFMTPLSRLCEKAYRRNQLVVAAKRNMPLVDNGFPAELSSCIGVDMGRHASAFELLFRRAEIIQFVAHGDRVRVAAAGGGRTTMSGTSFAAPAVSGLCALLLGAHPDLCPFDVKALLRAFARQDQPGREAES
jgi:subtilisin family serine protease